MSTHDHPLDLRIDLDGRLTTAVVAALDDGEAGLQIAVARDDRILVDIAGGSSGGMAITTDHLVPVFSVSKAIVAATVLELVEDGSLGLDEQVSHYWPEFAAHGKASITIRQVLEHSAGLHRLPTGTGPSDLPDWHRMTTSIAAATPAWRPGTRTAYHALTSGWILGETVCRAIGSTTSFGEVMRELLLDSLPERDFWIGLPDTESGRVAQISKQDIAAAASALRAAESLEEMAAALPPAVAIGQQVWGREDIRRGTIPAAGGIGNARTLAMLFASLADASRRSWPAEVARSARWRRDVAIGEDLHRGLGFYVGPADRAGHPPFSNRSSFGHPGSGGSVAWADRATGTGYAIVRTGLTPAGWRDKRVQNLAEAMVTSSRLDR